MYLKLESSLSSVCQSKFGERTGGHEIRGNGDTIAEIKGFHHHYGRTRRDTILKNYGNIHQELSFVSFKNSARFIPYGIYKLLLKLYFFDNVWIPYV